MRSVCATGGVTTELEGAAESARDCACSHGVVATPAKATTSNTRRIFILKVLRVEPAVSKGWLTGTVRGSCQPQIRFADDLVIEVICCLLGLLRRGTGVLLWTRRSQMLVRWRASMPCPKECCGTSCGGRRWRESSRCPARLPRLPKSSRQIRLSSASRSTLPCSTICLFRQKCDGRPGQLPLNLHR